MNCLEGHARADRVTVVAAALFDARGHVLVQQRRSGQHAGLWEFPGGKVEPGERCAAALARELAEELGIVAPPDDLAPLGYSIDNGGRAELLLLLFACRRWTGTPRAFVAGALRWVEPAALTALPMPPADVPLAAALPRWISG